MPHEQRPDHDYEDIEAIRAMQQFAYDAEIQAWKAEGGHPQDWPGARPDTVDATRKSETVGGELLATGYELIAPFLGLFDG